MNLMCKNIYKSLSILFIIVCTVIAAGCTDDILFDDSYIPDGDAKVEFVVDYRPLVEMKEEAGTRATPDGWADGTVAPFGEGKLTSVNSVTVLFYDENQNLIKDYSGPVATYTNNSKPRDLNATNVGQIAAETKTPQVTFSKTIKSGKYYVFSVLNTSIDLNQVPTIEDLRSLPIKFTSNDIPKNLQMFGVFTSGDAQQAENMDFEEDKLLSIRPGNVQLHSWARRALAKITIDFDGSELRNNVEVYIKSAKIRTLANWAYLGKPSKVLSDADTVASAHTLVYGTGSSANGGYKNWPSVSRGSGRLDSYTLSDKTKLKFHNEYAPSLVCFENMQGKGEKKFQDRDNDGVIDHPDSGEPDHEFYRDGKEFGTYLEVTGYYVGPLSSGPITYRFMLGNDAVDNYDVTRNHHYKITMCFRGNGNDVDWHVQYKEIPPKIYTNGVYASYAYNEPVTIPVRVLGGEVNEIKAEIIENNWHPETNINGNTYFTNAESLGWSGKGDAWKNDYFSYIQDGVKHKGLGFLSLYQSKNTSLIYSNKPSGDEGTLQEQYYPEAYWEGKDIHRGKIANIKNESTDPSNSLGIRTYTGGEVHEVNNIKETRFNIEAYTREKNLVKSTGYSGQNFYEVGTRIAKVKLTVNVNVDGKNTTLQDTVTVTQARRVTNPTAVYRRWDNNKKFHVNLKYADKEPSSDPENIGEFTSVKSNGPWRAVIENIGDPGIISLTKYWGDHNSEIDFDINFNGNGDQNRSKFAIITIYYHNYSCIHRIFVRQGYTPTAVIDGGCRWHAGNVNYRANSEIYDVENPIDEGSMFRYGNWGFGISSTNNYRSGFKFNDTPTNTFESRERNLSSPSKSTWSNITFAKIISKNAVPEYSFIDALVAGSGKTPPGATTEDEARTNAENNLKARQTANKPYPATFDDFHKINTNVNCEFAYGVVYGDDAGTTASSFAQAFGHNSDHGDTNDYGMRCVIVYNKMDARHVMFPIGGSGYGHRDDTGRLRYAGRSEMMKEDLAESRAPFWNIMYTRGAIYWLAMPLWNTSGYNTESDPSYANAWDMNYKTMDFSHYGYNAYRRSQTNTPTLSDAGFIRMVEKP